MVKELLTARSNTGRRIVPGIAGGIATYTNVMPRLDRGIQYAAASWINHERRGVLDRPVKPGDDSACVGARSTISVIASAAKQSRIIPRRDSGLLRRKGSSQ
ncbi:hypothetical protein DCM80_20060 [Bradyrhizobium sp. WBOS08]|nr:hypothetical protein DCM80_20060 [Bradyrhizobium sp. WBOS08]